MFSSGGYADDVDAMDAADHNGCVQYWMDYRIVHCNQYGVYGYLLTDDQNWRHELGIRNLGLVAYRQRDNTSHDGFTNWRRE